TFDPLTSQIKFHPVVPRYLQVQGYKIDYWMYTVSGVTTYVLPDGTTSGTAPTLSDLDSSDTYQEFNILAEVIENLSFAQGSTITFTAHYAVKNDVYDMTVAKGRVYAMGVDDNESPVLLPKGNVYKVSNYGMVKLVADGDPARDGSFKYWTLNGQIYSYDREVIFSAWCNADFVAVFDPDNGQQVPTPAAFISNNVQTFGFDTTDRRYHKISFDCAFYIPDKNKFLSCGIIYSPDANNLSDQAFKTSGLSVTDYGTFENMPDITAVASAEYDQLFAKANHQVIISITGVANDKYRSARAYYIYNDNGTPSVVFSSTIATVHTPNATS
ncbi:MAG: hypothetical protein IJU04_00110, partial [Ruminococcus sp.]|nr:hypothetical protein [Ruminococcus sp.]